MNRKNSVLLVIFLLPLFVSCAIFNASETNLRAASPVDVIDTIAPYRIGIDDEIQVSVWRNGNLSVTVPVRPDGKISTPLAGDVQAAGLTPVELSREITKKLSLFIDQPEVTVILMAVKSKEYSSRIRITGAVKEDTSLPHKDGITVLDAVIEAGGLTKFASPNRAKLYRAHDHDKIAFAVRLKDIMTKGLLETNYALRPGDVITVPERIF